MKELLMQSTKEFNDYIPRKHSFRHFYIFSMRMNIGAKKVKG